MTEEKNKAFYFHPLLDATISCVQSGVKLGNAHFSAFESLFPGQLVHSTAIVTRCRFFRVSSSRHAILLSLYSLVKLCRTRVLKLHFYSANGKYDYWPAVEAERDRREKILFSPFTLE